MRKLLLITCLLTFLCSNAQLTGFPPSTKWQQINTDTARIIFPKAINAQAQRIASLIHQMAKDTSLLARTSKHKIDVVLHNRTTLANGYVQLAPFRSEYFLIPPSDVFYFGNLPWHENLAIHEFRHVQQYNNYRRGLGKLMYILFGESGLAAAANLVSPDWYFEGDAVFAETALTPYGRGRRPFFLNGYKALWQEGINYNWMKLRNGSLKDFVPDHYQLGYHFVNYGYEKYGKDFWTKVVHEANSIADPGFKGGIRKLTGLKYRDFTQQAFAHYKKDVQKADIKKGAEPNTVISYRYSKIIGEDSVLSFKTSYKEIPAFILKDKNGERRISLQYITTEDWFDHHNGKVAYTAYRTHPRWDLVNYSDIVLLDIRTKKQRWLTHHKRYYTPSFSPNGAKIIAVSVTDSLTNELHLLDTQTGGTDKVITDPAHYFIQPVFLTDNTIAVVVRNEAGKLSIQERDLEGRPRRELIPFTSHTIGNMNVNSDSLFFSASFSGNDELYALKISNGELFKLTNTQTGNYFPFVKNDQIVYSQFTAHGLRLQEKRLKDLAWTPYRIPAEHDYNVSGRSSNILDTPPKDFEVTRYKKSTGLFNFHSWIPFYDGAEATFTIRGDNVLNTFSNELFYRYNNNERSHTAGYTAIYGALFPVLSLGGEYTFNRHIYRPADTITLDQMELIAGVDIPLNFTQGKTVKGLNLGTSFHYNKSTPTGASKGRYIGSSSTYLDHSFSWSHYLPLAVQHLAPRFGYSASFSHRYLLNKTRVFQTNANAQLFLPSAFRTHSIQLRGGYQMTDTGNVIFADRFVHARGYQEYYLSKMWRYSVNYSMPLWYPDWGFANLLYFQRLRTNLFYDHSKLYNKSRTVSQLQRSIGAELFTDTKIMNGLPITFGVRYSRLLDNEVVGPTTRRNVWEIVIPLNLPQ